MANPPPAGLLSNVLNYVSREIECFVATATGGNPPEIPKASSSRVKLDGPQQAGGSTDSRKDAGGPKRSNEEVPAAAAREETRLGPSRQLRRDPPGNLQPHKAPLANDVQLSQPVPIPSKDGHAGGIARRVPDAALPPPNRPHSLPNVLSRKPSATMPGSLFPRSASLEPDPTPAVSRLNSARPSARRAPAAKSPLYQSIKEEEEDEADLPVKVPAAWSPGSPENPFVIEDDAPRNRQNVISSTEDALRFLNEQHPSPRSSPSPMAPPTPNTSKSKLPEDDEEDVQPSMFKSKGKERAHDSVYDFLHSDISQEIRIRGTEDELLRAREEHLRKEQEQDADTTLALEERERDKERIRFLEAEVTRLRSQLSQQRHQPIIGVPEPPPPPPPPPLPPPRRTIIPPLTVSSIRKRSGPLTQANTDAFLQSARAALRKQAPPVEAPINAINAPPIAQRLRRKSVAQPTVNVPSDKMADFLNEVRSAKLKKVSGTLAPPLVRKEPPSSTLAHTLSNTGKGRDILREMVRRKSMTHLDAHAGDKRKRSALDGDEFAVPSLPAKRVAKQGSSSSDTSSSSMASTSSNPHPNGRSFTLADLNNRTWPSVSTTDTDLTTPSLVSDNDNDHTSDTLPPTPPRPHRSPEPSTSGGREQDDPLPEIIDLIDIDVDAEIGAFENHADTPLADSSFTEDAFTRRPVGPSLSNLTPKKPRPPGRTRIPRPPQRPPQYQSQSQSQSSSQSSFQSSSFQSSSQSSSHSYSQPIDTQSDDDHSPRKTRIRVIDLSAARKHTAARRAGKKKDIKMKNSSSHSRIKPSSTSSQESDPGPVSTSAHSRRRRTLDEELQRAGDHLWESADDLESGTLTGVGVKNHRGGFLARGGGGGSPVFMGVGYVQGAEEIEREMSTFRNGVRSVQ